MLKASENVEEEDTIDSKHQIQKHYTLFERIFLSHLQTTQSNLKTLTYFDKGKQDDLHKETIDLGAQVEAENKKGDLVCKDD
ncbi:uncharacterized protein G2W53_015430 [Senna tora]|uniref:Uncharacterized protein n=1 Tax=Senna tora TaxID=362788 RepID=A0A834WVM8_9FABA|nr:uncharacterized protein G2W53_015430 [Senna tora]